jgi:hypothetical protein
MLTTKNKSEKSANKNSPLDTSKRSVEKSKSGQKEKIVYPKESEATNQREGVDATFTERNDVTPQIKKSFHLSARQRQILRAARMVVPLAV